MKQFHRSLTVFVFVVAVAMLGGVGTVEAQYLDPGSGSYLLQFAIAAILAASVFWKGIFGRSRDVLSRIVRKVVGRDDRRDPA